MQLVLEDLNWSHMLIHKLFVKVGEFEVTIVSERNVVFDNVVDEGISVVKDIGVF